MFYVGSLGCNALQIAHGNPEGPETQMALVATNNLQPVYVQTYRVKEGENLYDVAIRWGVSPSRLKEHNHLTNLNIRAGRILEIPDDVDRGKASREMPDIGAENNILPASLNTYVVKEGEDLYDVAIRFAVSPSDLRAWNKLDMAKLKAGRILKVSNGIDRGKPSWAVPADVADKYMPPASSKMYAVKEGEDLYAVAIRWGVSPSNLKMLNKLTTPNLKAGQLLKLPVGYVEDGK